MKTVVYFTIHKKEVEALRRDFAVAEHVSGWPDHAPAGADTMRFRLIMFNGVIDAQVYEQNVIGELAWASLGTQRGRLFHGFEIYGATAVAIGLRRAVGSAASTKVRQTRLSEDVVEYDLDGHPATGAPVLDVERDHMEMVQTSLANRARAIDIETRITELDDLGNSLSQAQTMELVRLMKDVRELDLSDAALSTLVTPGTQNEELLRLHKTGALVTTACRLAREVRRWRDAAAALPRDTEDGERELVH